MESPSLNSDNTRIDKILKDRFLKLRDTFSKFGLEDKIDIDKIEQDLKTSNPEDVENVLEHTLNKIPFLNKEIKEVIKAELKRQKSLPIEVIGIGQTGVGKSTIIKSLFKLENESDLDIHTDSIKVATVDIQDYILKTKAGFTIKFTDIRGLAETTRIDEEILPKIIQRVKESDLVYWVVTAADRKYGADEIYIKRIFSGDLNKKIKSLLIVLNHIDRILLSPEEEDKEQTIWDKKNNIPTEFGEKKIKEVKKELLKRFSHLGINENQIIECLATRGYHVNKLFEKLLEFANTEFSKLVMLESRGIDSIENVLKGELKERVQRMTNQEIIKKELKKNDLDPGYKKLLEIKYQELETEKKLREQNEKERFKWLKKIFKKAYDSVRNNLSTIALNSVNILFKDENLTQVVNNIIEIFKVRKSA